MTRWIGVIGMFLVLLGSIFAAYDSFVFGNKINSTYLPICKQWNSVINEVEPYTINSKQSLENIKPFYVSKYGDERFKTLLAIIQMNYNSVIKSPIKRIVINVPVLYGGTRLDGRVNLEYNNDGTETICAPDTLLQWIKDYRKNWFLKWGLIAIAVGSFLQILQELIKKERQKMDEKRIKRIIGIALFIIAIIILAVALVTHDLSAHRLLVAIALSTFGIAAKAYFFIPFYKKTSDPSADMAQIRLSYLHYVLVMLVVIGLLYLYFYSTIITMPGVVFYLSSIIVFTSMGFVVPSVMKFLKI